MQTSTILQAMAPTGTLRAGVYTGNFLLITGKTAEGDPDGVSPDLCRAIAARLGVPLKLIPFKSQ
ncbi:MAG: ABC transporter substrate-binding protein, partial [Sphingobacteriia bacterium]|nr:ABC transporter substrate-binding protein [Sphingobacteriia bacterium]